MRSLDDLEDTTPTPERPVEFGWITDIGVTTEQPHGRAGSPVLGRRERGVASSMSSIRSPVIPPAIAVAMTSIRLSTPFRATICVPRIVASFGRRSFRRALADRYIRPVITFVNFAWTEVRGGRGPPPSVGSSAPFCPGDGDVVGCTRLWGQGAPSSSPQLRTVKEQDRGLDYGSRSSADEFAASAAAARKAQTASRCSPATS